MGKVVFIDPIDHISGKIGTKSETIYSHRSATGRNYVSKQGVRTTAVTEEEKTRQQLFKTVAQSTRERLKDPMKMANDMVAFSNQKKHKTLYGYVFNQEWEAATA